MSSKITVSGLEITGSIVAAHGLSRSVTCGISLDEGQTPVSCIGWWILYPTREAHVELLRETQ